MLCANLDTLEPAEVKVATQLDHRNLNVTRRYYRIGHDRRREAVDKVTALSFDRHGGVFWLRGRGSSSGNAIAYAGRVRPAQGGRRDRDVLRPDHLRHRPGGTPGRGGRVLPVLGPVLSVVLLRLPRMPAAVRRPRRCVGCSSEFGEPHPDPQHEGRRRHDLARRVGRQPRGRCADAGREFGAAET